MEGFIICWKNIKIYTKNCKRCAKTSSIDCEILKSVNFQSSSWNLWWVIRSNCWQCRCKLRIWRQMDSSKWMISLSNPTNIQQNSPGRQYCLSTVFDFSVSVSTESVLRATTDRLRATFTLVDNVLSKRRRKMSTEGTFAAVDQSTEKDPNESIRHCAQ